MPPVSASLRRLLAPAAFLAAVCGFHAANVLSWARAAFAEDEEAEDARPFERAPDPAAVPGADADLYVEGCELQAKGQYKLARKRFWKLIDLYPNSPYRSEAEDRSGDRDGGNAFLGFTAMGPTGPSERRIDVALMGDGYLLEKQDVFEKHAVGELDLLLKEPTYGEYRAYFNFWRFNLASRDTGVDEGTPRAIDEEEQEREAKRKKRKGPRQFDTAIDCKAAGPQGQVMANPVRVYHYLAYLDVNDSLVIAFAQKGVLGMGGGGIATTGPRGVVVHEFGHAFGWLLDEYANNPGPPAGQVSAANATTDKDHPPWQHFLDARVPKVGVFEGGATFQKGVFRPAPSCAMNTGGGDPYCPVCREQVILTIYSYVSPIDEASPTDAEVVRGPTGWPAIRVVPQTPTSHTLDVKWFLGAAPVVTPAATAPTDTVDPAEEELTPEERRLRKRQKERGGTAPAPAPAPGLPDLPPDDALPVPTLEDPAKEGGLQDLRPKALRQQRRNAGTAHDAPPAGKEIAAKKDKLDGGRTAWSPVLPELSPGRHLLTVVVSDPTRLKGERFPWVLKDEKGLLEDRRAWVLVVPDGKGK
jgi:hypothetical protein